MTDSRIAQEQDYADALFGRLDAEVQAAQRRLEAVALDVDPDNPDADALVRRETEYHGLNAKLDDLNVAETGLVFGRIDVADDSPENPADGRENVDRRYIGRMAIDDRADDYRTLLLDWRAPMARPYYLATTAHPEGVETRRNIRMRGRSVTAVDDEVLSGWDDADTIGETSGTTSDVSSEAALRRAMNAPRTGHMQSIVENYPARAGSDHPGFDPWSPGCLWWTGNGQDRGRPAPRCLPAVHVAGPARAHWCPHCRAESHLPRLHLPGSTGTG